MHAGEGLGPFLGLRGQSSRMALCTAVAEAGESSGVAKISLSSLAGRKAFNWLPCPALSGDRAAYQLSGVVRKLTVCAARELS